MYARAQKPEKPDEVLEHHFASKEPDQNMAVDLSVVNKIVW